MAHYYKNQVLVPEGTPGALPSVTTILDVRRNPGLEEWRLRIGAEAAYEITRLAQEKGTAVHKACELFLTTSELVDIEADWLPYFDGFVNWFGKILPTDISSEKYLESAYGYCGTADLICRYDDEWWIIDFKTSKQMKPEMGLQLRAYEQAAFEKSGHHYRMAILQLTDKIKRGYRFKEYEGSLEVFLAHKAIHDWTVETSKRTDVMPAGITID